MNSKYKEVLEYEESAGGLFSGLSSKVKEDRHRAVEVVRKNTKTTVDQHMALI
jgi:hypothetical protein